MSIKHIENYIDQAMKPQSDVDNSNLENNDRAELEDICVTTKALFLSLPAKNGQSNVPEMCFSDNHTSRASQT